MIKVVARDKGQGVKCGVKLNCRGKRAAAREAVGVIATICEAVHKAVPEFTPEELMGAAMGKLKGGLTVKCYGSPEECAECDPDGWCNRFNGLCETFCVGEMVADGEDE